MCPDCGATESLLGVQAAGLGERLGFHEPARGSAAQDSGMPGNVGDWDVDEDASDDEGGAPEAPGMPPQYTVAMAERCAPRAGRLCRMCSHGVRHTL